MSHLLNCSQPQPVTRDEFLKKKKRLPPGLFAVGRRVCVNSITYWPDECIRALSIEFASLKIYEFANFPGEAISNSNGTRPQHNLMQKSAQTVDAQNGSAQGKPLCVAKIKAANAKQIDMMAHIVLLAHQGILARMFDALRRSQKSPPHKSNLFSLAGSKKILSGSKEVLPGIVSPTKGISRLTSAEYKELQVLCEILICFLRYKWSAYCSFAQTHEYQRV